MKADTSKVRPLYAKLAACVTYIFQLVSFIFPMLAGLILLKLFVCTGAEMPILEGRWMNLVN